MSESGKMVCTDCGADMNHHAMKVDYIDDEGNAETTTFGGVLTEIHTCPGCGKAGTRAAI
jgi:hypothetical protein